MFVTGLAEEVFPHYLSIQTGEQLEEERRLFYVAVTRAKEKLYLTYPKRLYVNNFYESFYRSRFLDEIDANSLNVVEALYQDRLEGKAQEKMKQLKNFSGFYKNSSKFNS